MKQLIKKDTPLPVNSKSLICEIENNQDSIIIEIRAGDSLFDIEENEFLGELLVDNIPPSSDSKKRQLVFVQYEISFDGELKICAWANQNERNKKELVVELFSDNENETEEFKEHQKYIEMFCSCIPK